METVPCYGFEIIARANTLVWWDLLFIYLKSLFSYYGLFYRDQRMGIRVWGWSLVSKVPLWPLRGVVIKLGIVFHLGRRFRVQESWFICWGLGSSV